MRTLAKLRLRLRSLFGRRQVETELDRELQFHLDQQAAENFAAGMNPNEARSAALHALGRPTRIKEECREVRGLRLLDELGRDLRYAARSLGKTPGFSTVAVATIALGIGATTAIFSMVNGVLLRPLPYSEPDRLVAVWETAPELGIPVMSFSYPNYLDLVEQNSSFAQVGAWRSNQGILQVTSGERQFVRSRMISAGLPELLGIPLEAGRTFSPEEDRIGGAPAALVSDALSDRLFGGPSAALGRELIYRDIPYTIVGVLPTSFRVSSGGPDPVGEADVFTPLGQENDASMVRRDAKSGFRVVGRLASDVGLDEVQAELEAIASRLKTAYPGAFIASSFLTRPMAEEFVGTTLPRTLMLLFSAVVVLFLIASANVANLVLARSVSRREEFAIRAALGAGRRRLVAQCLTESLCLSLAGGAGGVALAQGTTTFLVGLWPGGLPRAEEITLDWRVLVFAAAASLVTGLVFGLIPTRRLHGVRPEDSSRRVIGHSRRAQSALVVSELAMTLVLLAAAGATVATMMSLWSLDAGFDSESVLAAELLMSPGDGDTAGEILSRWNQALDAVRSNPEVAAAALTSQIPLTGSDASFLYRTTPEPLPTSETPTALTTVTTPQYRAVMNIPLVAGRYFSDLDRTDTEPVVVIDEVLAEAAFPGENALGRKLFVLGERTVVGVVGHVRHFGLRADDVAPIREQMYLPLNQLPDGMLLDRDRLDIVAAARPAPDMTATAVRTTLERGSSWNILDMRTMNAIVRDSSRAERFILYLFNGLGVLALLLSAVGLYGVVAYLARQRISEFGLRLALGAKPVQVDRLVLGHALRMFAIGAAIGLVLIIALSRVWNNAVDNAEPIGTASIGAAVAVLGTAVLLASYGPLRRASRIDPMAALRHE